MAPGTACRFGLGLDIVARLAQALRIAGVICAAFGQWNDVIPLGCNRDAPLCLAHRTQGV